MKQKCQHKPSKWELEFYGSCGQCYIEANWEKRTAAPGEWTRHSQAELGAYAKETLQPVTRQGKVNKHFVQVYGTKILEKEMKMTRKQIIAQAE
jgi:hypothetical protein